MALSLWLARQGLGRHLIPLQKRTICTTLHVRVGEPGGHSSESRCLQYPRTREDGQKFFQSYSSRSWIGLISSGRSLKNTCTAIMRTRTVGNRRLLRRLSRYPTILSFCQSSLSKAMLIVDLLIFFSRGFLRVATPIYAEPQEALYPLDPSVLLFVGPKGALRCGIFHLLRYLGQPLLMRPHCLLVGFLHGLRQDADKQLIELRTVLGLLCPPYKLFGTADPLESVKKCLFQLGVSVFRSLRPSRARPYIAALILRQALDVARHSKFLSVILG